MDQKISQLDEMVIPVSHDDGLPIIDTSEDKNYKIALGRVMEVKGTQILTESDHMSELLYGQGVFCDTSSSPFTVKLPPYPEVGDSVGICDYKETFTINALTVDGNGNKIHRTSDSLTLDRNGSSVYLTYVDNVEGWKLTGFNLPWR